MEEYKAIDSDKTRYCPYGLCIPDSADKILVGGLYEHRECNHYRGPINCYIIKCSYEYDHKQGEGNGKV